MLQEDGGARFEHGTQEYTAERVAVAHGLGVEMNSLPDNLQVSGEPSVSAPEGRQDR